MATSTCVYCFGAGSIVDSAYLTRNVEHVTCSVCQGTGLLVHLTLSPREAEALMHKASDGPTDMDGAHLERARSRLLAAYQEAYK